ncbi:NAD(P)-dependent oxidoreductase, partial [Acinetobacter baumannii]|uniref:NAD(P)-dependent oxidoreductase n=1 Tax=Acinetobacter baumannii TaxID=470 RepID=UPI0037D667BF
VAQYVFSCLSYLAINTSQSLRGKVIGIVGVGHVGREVERIARSIGMLPLLYDPPRAEVEGIKSFSSLDELLEKSDIITLHVPLNSETKHLITKE